MKMTIYVPDALRNRMRKFDDQVNWSPIACQAFAAKLAELAAKKRRPDMKDVIDRLRASQLKHDDATTRQWRTAGEKWAKHHAEWAELERLAEYCESYDFQARSHGLTAIFSMPTAAPHSHADLVFLAMRPEIDNPDRFDAQEQCSESREFWSAVADDIPRRGEVPSDLELKAFVDAVLDVYRSVRKQL